MSFTQIEDGNLKIGFKHRKKMKAFITGHEELIHDVKYDFYGTHIASCSSDQHIKVFELDASTRTWVLNDSWKAHDSSIVKLSWAHPELSSSKILASCSYDRTVKIWQEQVEELHGSGRRWIKLATLAIESFGPIYDVTFAPSHLGLKLGCIGSDGIVRIYESLDPSDQSNWSLSAEVPVLSQTVPTKSLQSTFALEWCPSKFAKSEKFVVLALDQGFIYASTTNSRSNESGSGSEYGSRVEKDKGSLNASIRYQKLCNLPEHNGLIRTVSWAPSMGRDYHYIATGCKDGYVRIFKITENSSGELEIETAAKLNDHKSEVWKVTWNSTGTILSSAGSDGKIRLWKCNYLNEWKCMSVIDSGNKTNKGLRDEIEEGVNNSSRAT
ncbi:Piso0_005229 [Millerozyma farinosa CBS 7064]|uniref:Piso0_005229 protein n=1 Tax=Pichia sorbitophila (strain ATCC MYA-4447 / BCRC 22081 / CBS 7064 / NBRC 10061 / NRRL Y-12695) TaxID=559304 RepID=G8Y4J7_PICSO|nr:Piso0_005229 [Millerozyma farinosa CBS 7064]